MTVIFSKLPLQFTGTNGIIHKLVYSNIYFPAPIRGPKSKGGGDFVNNYEVMYIVKPVEEEAFEALVAKFDNLINNNGGTVEKLIVGARNVLLMKSTISQKVCMFS